MFFLYEEEQVRHQLRVKKAECIRVMGSMTADNWVYGYMLIHIYIYMLTYIYQYPLMPLIHTHFLRMDVNTDREIDK